MTTVSRLRLSETTQTLNSWRRELKTGRNWWFMCKECSKSGSRYSSCTSIWSRFSVSRTFYVLCHMKLKSSTSSKAPGTEWSTPSKRTLIYYTSIIFPTCYKISKNRLLLSKKFKKDWKLTWSLRDLFSLGFSSFPTTIWSIFSQKPETLCSFSHTWRSASKEFPN